MFSTFAIIFKLFHKILKSNSPQDSKTGDFFCQRLTAFFIWGNRGSMEFQLPENTSYQLGAKTTTKYLIFHIHFKQKFLGKLFSPLILLLSNEITPSTRSTVMSN